MSKKVHIIGTGLAGLAIAHRFGEAGFQPVLIGLDRGASAAAAGVSSLKGWLDPRTDFFKAKYAGHQNLRSLVSELQSASGHQIASHQSVFEVFESQKEFHRIISRVFHNSFTGCKAVQLVDNNELQRLSPNLSPFTGGFRFPLDFWVNVDDLMSAYRTHLTRYRAEFITKNVTSLKSKNPKENHIILDQSEKLVSEITILAAGSGTPGVAEASGILLPDLKPVAGRTAIEKSNINCDLTILHSKGSVTFHGDNLIWGSNSTQGTVPEDLDRSEIGVQLSNIINVMRVGVRNRSEREGVRVRTKTRVPMMGYAGFGQGPGVWICTGLYKNGMQLADIMAKSLVKMYRNQPVDSFLNSFLF